MSEQTTTTATKYYLIELRDSDGNDCSVYELLVEATGKDAAIDHAWSYIDSEWPDDEHDGGGGTFHPCDCICPHRNTGNTQRDGSGICDDCTDSWECSHGGLLLDTFNIEEHETYEAARAAHATYHVLIDLAPRHTDECTTANDRSAREVCICPGGPDAQDGD